MVCYYCNKHNHGEDVIIKRKLSHYINISQKHNFKILDNVKDIKPRVERFEEPHDEDKAKEMAHTFIATTISPTTSHEKRRR